MNELQEFFQSVAIEKKKVAEEQARIQAREERLMIVSPPIAGMEYGVQNPNYTHSTIDRD